MMENGNNGTPSRIEAPATAEAKAELIHTALEALRTASLIDERDTLPDADAVAWYDAIIPDVVDIKTIAAHLEIELAIRRGERIKAEGERRGGDQKSPLSSAQQINVGSEPTSIPNSTERAKRSYDRLLADQKPAVVDYQKAANKNGQRPSVKGAIKFAREARQATKTSVSRRPAKAEPIPDDIRARNKFTQQADLLAAEGRPLRADEVERILGMRLGERFLEIAPLIPWMIVRNPGPQATYEIDHELRELCEVCMLRAELGWVPLRVFLRKIHAEVTRRRAEARKEQEASGWSVDTSRKRVQTELLDWIEDQLDMVPRLGGSLRTWQRELRAEIKTRREGNEDRRRNTNWKGIMIVEHRQVELLNWVEHQILR